MRSESSPDLDPLIRCEEVGRARIGYSNSWHWRSCGGGEEEGWHVAGSFRNLTISTSDVEKNQTPL